MQSYITLQDDTSLSCSDNDVVAGVTQLNLGISDDVNITPCLFVGEVVLADYNAAPHIVAREYILHAPRTVVCC